MVEKILVLALLGINAELDYKRKEISLVSVVIFSILSFLFYYIDILEWKWNQLSALIPGICILIAAWYSHGKIGLGDGLILLILGLVLSINFILILLFFSLWGVILYGGIIGKKLRIKRVAFVPFLLCGYIGGLLMGL